MMEELFVFIKSGSQRHVAATVQIALNTWDKSLALAYTGFGFFVFTLEKVCSQVHNSAPLKHRCWVWILRTRGIALTCHYFTGTCEEHPSSASRSRSDPSSPCPGSPCGSCLLWVSVPWWIHGATRRIRSLGNPQSESSTDEEHLHNMFFYKTTQKLAFRTTGTMRMLSLTPFWLILQQSHLDEKEKK